MARVVVTGGAGFLGSHLSEALLARGDEVVCLDNLLTGSIDNIEHLFGTPGYTYVEQNVSDYVWVPGAVDAVMHLASPASPKDYLEMPIQTLKVGSLGTHKTLGLAKAKGARFFLASTSEVYGDPQVHPQPESYWGHVNPIGPRGVYDEAKRFAEAITMAYHRYHGLEVRIVRIFNSILADEQVLYDDGVQLRREAAADAALRLGVNANLTGVSVPAFDIHREVSPAETIALVAHPTSSRCYEVRTKYGRSIRVTGDHSLFVKGEDGMPIARPVSELEPGDRVAIAGRLAVPERDRRFVEMTEVWDEAGCDPWSLLVRWPGLGEALWSRRFEAFAAIERRRRPDSKVWRSIVWGEIARHRQRDQAPLGLLREMSIAIPAHASVRLRTSGKSTELPLTVHVSDDLLWVIGMWVAEGNWLENDHDAALGWACDEVTLDRVAKVLEYELGLHCVRAEASSQRSAALIAHSRLAVALLRHLGFASGDKCIPGWILGLPLARLRHFIEGYRQGDGVHSGAKVGNRHEFSTTSATLKDDLVVALARFGIVPSVGLYNTKFKQRTGNRKHPFWRVTALNVEPWHPLDWDETTVHRIDAERDGDLVWAPIKAVSEVPATALVYDFSVPGRENFWAGSGVMAHNTYGPRMRPQDGRVVSNFVVQALLGKPITVYGDGRQTRSFCYVEDEIRGFLALLDSDITGPCNIGNPGEFTMLELADLVLELTGSASEIVFEPLPVDDPTQRQPDITQARDVLGWEPVIDLREGLSRTIPYFRRQLGL